MKANKTEVSTLLKTARGQIDGILKMVEEDRYCIDISNQVLATVSILNKTNKAIIKAHLGSCVRQAVADGNDQEKIDEILALLDKLSR